MTAQLHEFPVDATIFDRLTEQQRLANIQQERAEAVEDARAVFRSPSKHSDQVLRDASAVLQAWGDADDWMQADAMIFALNTRERKRAHEVARRANETPAQVAKRFLPQWPLIAGCAAVLAVLMLAAMGWM